MADPLETPKIKAAVAGAFAGIKPWSGADIPAEYETVRVYWMAGYVAGFALFCVAIVVAGDKIGVGNPLGG